MTAMYDEEEDSDATVEVTLTSDELEGEDKRFAGFTFLVQVTIDPGFKGSLSWNAPSDIDYHGQGPGVEDVISVRVRAPAGFSFNPASTQEREAFNRWSERHDDRFNALAVSAWGGSD